jgi:hypothetical protein
MSQANMNGSHAIQTDLMLLEADWPSDQGER